MTVSDKLDTSFFEIKKAALVERGYGEGEAS